LDATKIPARQVFKILLRFNIMRFFNDDFFFCKEDKMQFKIKCNFVLISYFLVHNMAKKIDIEIEKIF